MLYSFCNLVIKIEDNPSFLLQNYEGFRLEDERVSDITYCCYPDATLALPEKEPVFECVPGTRVYQDSDGGFIHYYDMANRLITRLSKEGDTHILTYREYRDNAISELDLINSLLLEEALADKGHFILHSSFIRTKYGAVLFTAPSGTGKSTQADLWKTYRGAQVINGDRTCVWKEGGTWMAGGALWCGTSGIMKNEMYPLAAIVVLKQGKVNTINQMRMVSRIARMMEQTTINDWDKKMYDQAQEFWIDLCGNIPVIELSCTPDERAVQALEEELEKYGGQI